MNKQLVEEIKKYIENTEVMIDGEWGYVRTLDELIQDNLMPELYHKICELAKNI